MRVAIIGLGRMGRVHFEALSMAGAEIIAGFDVNPESIESFQRETSVPSFPIDGLPVQLPRGSVEGVVVATTTPARFQLMTTVLTKTQPLWLLAEKPISSSLRQLEALQDLAKKSGTRLAINHQMMFLPQYVVVRELIDQGALGKLRSMNVSGSNFGLANNVSHFFEAFRFLTGEQVRQVNGFLESELLESHRGQGFIDYGGSVRAEGTDGATLYVDFDSRLGHGISATYSFDFGKVVVDELVGDVRISRRREEDVSEPSSRYGLPAVVQAIVFQPASLEAVTALVVKAVAEGLGPYPDENVASHSLRSVIATVASSENHSKVQSVDPADLAEYWNREFLWS